MFWAWEHERRYHSPGNCYNFPPFFVSVPSHFPWHTLTFLSTIPIKTPRLFLTHFNQHFNYFNTLLRCLNYPSNDLLFFLNSLTQTKPNNLYTTSIPFWGVLTTLPTTLPTTSIPFWDVLTTLPMTYCLSSTAWPKQSQTTSTLLQYPPEVSWLPFQRLQYPFEMSWTTLPTTSIPSWDVLTTLPTDQLFPWRPDPKQSGPKQSQTTKWRPQSEPKQRTPPLGPPDARKSTYSLITARYRVLPF